MANDTAKSASAAPFQVTSVPPLRVWLNPLVWILWILDFAIWLVTLLLPIFAILNCCRRCCTSFSYLDPNEDTEARRRKRSQWDEDEDSSHPSLLEKLDDEETDAAYETVWDIAEMAFEEFDEREAFGTRQYVGVDKTNPGPPRRIFKDTDWMTYEEVGLRTRAFGAMLVQKGLMPATPDTNLDHQRSSILIFEDTCAAWQTALLGAASQSIVVATSYATLGPKAVVDAIKDCNVSLVVCNRSKVHELAKDALSAGASALRDIVYTDHYVAEAEIGSPLQQPGGNIRCTAFEDFISQGLRLVGSTPVSPPKPDCLAVIMYTSGSTGKPKGVMITHGNIAASVAGLKDALGVTAKRARQETYVAHLPAAHIFEFCCELVMLSVGAKIGFADPRTLSSTGAVRQLSNGDLRFEAGYPSPPGAIQEFRPNMLVAVPVIWDTMKKKIEEEVGKKSFLVRSLFQAAYSAQLFARKTGRTCPLLNLLIFRKFHSLVGGQLNLVASGGGPISSDVQNFIGTVFGCKMIQGYALTETTCAGAAQVPWDTDTGTVGGPLASVELKVRSCDGPEDPKDQEGEYYLDDDTSHYGIPCQGRGEICIRGPSVSKGYYKQPDKWREVFDEEGWFHSGDIGYWDRKGRMVIVDRLKNLIKLKGGEYIAVEHMEKEFGQSPFVDGLKGGILCYGDGDMRRPGALVQVNAHELLKWATSQGISSKDLDELCQMDKAKEAVLKSLLGVAKNIGENEKLVGVCLISGTGPMDSATPSSPWTPENGCRTPSNKLDRRTIQKCCQAAMAEIKSKGS